MTNSRSPSKPKPLTQILPSDPSGKCEVELKMEKRSMIINKRTKVLKFHCNKTQKSLTNSDPPTLNWKQLSQTLVCIDKRYNRILKQREQNHKAFTNLIKSTRKHVSKEKQWLKKDIEECKKRRFCPTPGFNNPGLYTQSEDEDEEDLDNLSDIEDIDSDY